jgi:AraC family transcriptional regulator
MELLTHGRQKFPRAALAASSAGLGWRGIAAELRAHPAGDLPPFQSDQLEITLALAGERDAFVSRKGAGLRQQTRVDPGTIWISPVGVGEDDIRITRPLQRILHLYLPAQPFEALSDTLGGSRFGAQSIRYLAGVQDGLVRQIGQTLLDEMAAPTAGGRLLAESLGAALTARLVQAYSDRTDRLPAPPRQALDARRAERVLAYMQAHLAEDIGLHDLAAVACLSPFHFARMFRQRLGVPPHRYLAQLRIEAARRLLRTGLQPLADIAAACGFSGPSSFTRAFRQATGVTPGVFRRSGGPA